MAIGYLDTTPVKQERLNEYVSQYVPVPLDHLHKAGALVQKRGEEAIDAVDAQSAVIGQSAARAVDQAYRAQIQDRYNQEVDDLMAQGYNPASYEFQRAKSKMINKYANDQDLRNLAALKAEEDARKKYASDIQKAGGTVLDFDPTFSQAYGGDISAFNLGGSPIERTLDRRKAQEEYFNNLKDSGGFYNLQQAAPGLLQRTSWKGIEQGTTDAMAVDAVNNYLNTSAGSQEYRDLTQLQGFTDTQAKKQILGELLSAGRERVHMDRSVQTMNDPIFAARTKAAQTKQESDLDDLYSQKYLESLNAKGTKLTQEEFPIYSGLSEAALVDSEGNRTGAAATLGKDLYRVDLNKNDVIIDLGHKDKNFSVPVYTTANQIADKLKRIANLSDLQNDVVWGGSVSGATKVFLDRLTSGKAISDATTDVATGLGQEIKQLEQDLELLKVNDPLSYNAFKANAEYFLTGEGLKDAQLIKNFKDAGILNASLKGGNTNMKSVGGDTYIDMVGAFTHKEFEEGIGKEIDIDDVIDRGVLKVAKGEAGDEDAVYIMPGVKYKANPTQQADQLANHLYYGSAANKAGARQGFNQSYKQNISKMAVENSLIGDTIEMAMQAANGNVSKLNEHAMEINSQPSTVFTPEQKSVLANMIQDLTVGAWDEISVRRKAKNYIDTAKKYRSTDKITKSEREKFYSAPAETGVQQPPVDYVPPVEEIETTETTGTDIYGRPRVFSSDENTGFRSVR